LHCLRSALSALVQTQLAEVESSLTLKRAQLDTVASHLLARQKELDYEQQRAALSNEEATLLQVKGRRDGGAP
jgi:hypothetical protein